MGFVRKGEIFIAIIMIILGTMFLIAGSDLLLDGLNITNKGIRITGEIASTNVGEIRGYGIAYNIWILLIFGFVLNIFGGMILIKGLKYHDGNRKMVKNAEAIEAKITESGVNTYFSLNGNHPYVIYCEWENPEDGKVYLFKSNNIWYNPDKILNEKNIRTLTVYINRKNMKKYYVAIDEIEDSVVDLR